MRLLVCEDEIEIIRHLQKVLERQDGEVLYLDSVDKIDQQLKDPNWEPDIVILDRLFGNDDLVTYIQPMRDQWPNVSILILSAIDTPLEKAKAIEMGADDYLAKPFTKEELVARMNSLYRRRSLPIQELTQKNVRLNLNDRYLKFEEKMTDLSVKESEVLKLFFLAPGRVFSKEELFQKVWKASTEMESNTVETTLVRIRRKIEDLKAPLKIKNTRFVGYWLEI